MWWRSGHGQNWVQANIRSRRRCSEAIGGCGWPTVSGCLLDARDSSVDVNTSRRPGCYRHHLVVVVNRTDFQELAEVHLQNAEALLKARLYAGAYYMSGYVIECALKACICRRTKQFDFYPRPDEARDAWT